MKDYKWGDCIQCGWCCQSFSCGLGRNVMDCECLIPLENGQYRCLHYPFDHLDTFTMLCLDPGGGCGCPETEQYKLLWIKLKEAQPCD